MLQVKMILDESMERALIGAILIAPSHFIECQKYMRPQDFALLKHRYIWETYTNLHRNNIPIERHSVQHSLNRLGQLEGIGGGAYLSECVNEITSTSYTVVHAAMLRTYAVRNELGQHADLIMKLREDTAADVEAILDEIQSSYDRINTAYRATDEEAPKSIDVVLNEYLNNREAVIEDRKIHGDDMVSSGVRAVDTMLGGGFKRRKLYYIGGVPGSGKTTAMLQIAIEAAKSGQAALVAELEMTDEELVMRLLAAESGIEFERLEKHEELDTDETRQLFNAVAKVADYKNRIFLYSPSQMTPRGLWDEVVALNKKHPIRVVLVDYIGIMSASSDHSRNLTTKAQRVTHFAESFKWMRKQTKEGVSCSWIIGSQVKAEVEARDDKRPTRNDWAWSSEIQKSQDVGIMLYRHKLYNPESADDVIEYIVVKNRQGKQGTVKGAFLGGQYKIGNIHYPEFKKTQGA